MSYRRFGGGFHSKDSANIGAGSLGLILLVSFSLVALFTGKAGFVVIGFLCLFITMVFGIALPGGATSEAVRDIQISHLEKGEKYFDDKEYEKALEAFNSAKRYGNIPKQYQYAYHRTKRNLKNA